jgi:DNA-binding IclR family transcriptional regulator
VEDVTVPSGETELVVVSVAAPVTAPSCEVTVLVVVLVSEPEAQATSVLARAIRAAAEADWIRVLRIMEFLD